NGLRGSSRRWRRLRGGLLRRQERPRKRERPGFDRALRALEDSADSGLEPLPGGRGHRRGLRIEARAHFHEREPDRSVVSKRAHQPPLGISGFDAVSDAWLVQRGDGYKLPSKSKAASGCLKGGIT